MNNKKTIILVIVTVIIICTSITIALTVNNDDKTKQKKVEEITQKEKEEIQIDITTKVEEVFLSPESTKEDIEEIIGYPVLNHNYIVSEDSHIKVHPTKKMIKKYKLEEYVNRQQQYAERIEKEYLDNLKVTFKEPTAIDDDVYQPIEVISFYMGMYTGDLDELQMIIFTTNNDVSDIQELEEGSKEEAEFYKAKVEAMEILDNHFETYVNHEEVREVTVVYKDGKPKNSDEALTLLGNISGMTYPNAWFAEEGVLKEQRERLTQYLKEYQENKQ